MMMCYIQVTQARYDNAQIIAILYPDIRLYVLLQMAADSRHIPTEHAGCQHQPPDPKPNP